MRTKNIRLTFFVGLLAMIVACGRDGQKNVTTDEIVALEKEVMQIHDEVMPKMSDIARLMDILDKESANRNLDSLTQSEISKAIAMLQSGDSLMWEWMHNYGVPENISPDSIHTYLQTEKIHMTRIRDIMEAGIKNAEALAQKLGYGKPN